MFWHRIRFVAALAVRSFLASLLMLCVCCHGHCVRLALRSGTRAAEISTSARSRPRSRRCTRPTTKRPQARPLIALSVLLCCLLALIAMWRSLSSSCTACVLCVVACWVRGPACPRSSVCARRAASSHRILLSDVFACVFVLACRRCVPDEAATGLPERPHGQRHGQNPLSPDCFTRCSLWMRWLAC